MAIYDTGTAGLAANGQVTGVGTQWTMPLTLIRVGATLVFKTEPVQIYTISEITSDTSMAVYNPNGETVPAGTGYAILAHDGITVQGLAQDVSETLRYYQSRESEVATAVDVFKDFDQDKFSSDVNQVNTQHAEVVSIGAQVSRDATQVASDRAAAEASAESASSDKDAAAASAQEAADYAASLDASNLLRKDFNLSDVQDKALARTHLDLLSKTEIANKSDIAQGDALLGVMAPFTGAAARTQHDKNLDVISIADFGGGTGLVDNGPSLQRAITHAATASGNNRGMVYIPPGVWNFTSGVSVPGNVSIKGAGIGSTQLKTNTANLVLFDVGNGTNNPNNVSISDLHVLVSTTCTANPLFRFRNGYNCGIGNIRVDGPWYDLIHFRGGAAQFVYRVSDSILNGTSASRNTITIGESSEDGVVQDVFLTNLVLGGPTNGYGVYEKYSSGVYATNVDSLNARIGWAWMPADNCYCKGSFYTAILGDTNAIAGLMIKPRAGTTVNDLTFNGCWASSAGSNSSHHGLIIDSSAGTVANISFNGLTAVNNKGHGVYINGATTGYGYEFTNLSVSNNSQAGASLCSGMKIVAGSSHINISNGHAGSTLGLGTNNQAYGIDVEAGTGNSIKIVNMEMHNNKLGAMNFGATGPYNRIEGCSPFRTRMKGSVELKNGTSSITVNPGLNRPFGGSDVQVTPTTDLGALRYWVTQSGNSFTINTNANVSGGQWFSWAVDASYS